MKIFCFIITHALVMHGYSQLAIDPHISKKYDTVFAGLDPAFQAKFKNVTRAGEMEGLAIFTKYIVDTLNKEDVLISDITFRMERITPDGLSIEREGELVSGNTLIPDFAIGTFYHDTLNLSVSIFFPRINHVVTPEKVSSFYVEYNKYDSTFRLNIHEQKVAELLIPASTSKFVLNTMEYNRGKIIYGHVMVETQPYFADDSGFKNGFIKKRLCAEYVFKIRLKDP